MTKLSVIFCIIVYVSVLHGYSQASIYEVLGKNLSHLREGMENAGSMTRQSGTDRGWQKDDYYTQHKDSSQRDKQSRNENEGTYTTQDSRRFGSSSSYGGQRWESY